MVRTIAHKFLKNLAVVVSPVQVKDINTLNLRLSVKSNNTVNNKNNNKCVVEHHQLPGYWCIVEINKLVFRAKIIHIGRGKYKIVNHNSEGNFVGHVIDASDVLHCET